jgi:hypothetical protein
MDTLLYIQTTRSKLRGVIYSVSQRMRLQYNVKLHRLKSDAELLKPIPAFNIYIYIYIYPFVFARFITFDFTLPVQEPT